MAEHFTKTSQVFKRCRELIADTHVDFICHAIYLAEFGWAWKDTYIKAYPHYNSELSGKFLVAYDHVRELLGPHNSLEGWMLKNTENYNLIDDRTRRSKMRETRLAWLSHLILEFEAKGD